MSLAAKLVKPLPALVLTLGALLLLTPTGMEPARADLVPVVEPERPRPEADEPRGLPGLDLEAGRAASSEFNPWPGRMIGAGLGSPGGLFYQGWPHRTESYEILLKDKYALARMICGLAYFSGDLSVKVPLEKCIKGVQGFHYPVSTVRDWAQAVRMGRFEYRNRDEEERLINWLIAGGVLIQTGSGLEASGRIRHLIGASPGKRRSLALNLNHERLHVRWDKDQAFRDRHLGLWRADPAIKKDFLAAHRSYSDLPEPRQVEEWAVRRNEDKPGW